MAGEVGMTLSADLIQALETYFDVLALWNRKMNLTAFQLDAPSEAAIERLFLEPLQAAAALRRPVGAMIDVGSGGGSPAIPLCLALSPAHVTLVESRSRKSVFLKEAARRVGLAERLDVQNARFESLVRRSEFRGRFDLLTVRAVRVGAEELSAVSAFVRPGGQILWFAAGNETRVPRVAEARVAETIPLGIAGKSSAILLERS
jgi:16S rRNA (guanine527-N7)-methyltransferase